MKILYLGSGEFGINCLDAVANSDHELSLVVTAPPNPAGRGRKPNPTPVANWASSKSIPLLETNNVNSPEVVKKIGGCNPDLILVIAFGQKVSRELVNLPPKGSINVHGSLLPKYRGAAPINWVIIKGETKTGVSIITLADIMDAGKILSTSETDIAADETAGSLHDKLAKLAAPLLLDTLDQIVAGTVIYIEQDASHATLAPKLAKSDGYIDFNEPAQVLERKIRGFWPWPIAAANYHNIETGKSLRVCLVKSQVVETTNPPGLAAGTLDENLNIICGRNSLKITQIKPSCSDLMDFKSFVNGRNTRPGDYFSKINP